MEKKVLQCGYRGERGSAGYCSTSRGLDRYLTEQSMEDGWHILAWFVSRLINAVMEGTNSMISVIKSRARGFRDVQNLFAMCYVVSAQERTDMYGEGM